MTNLKFRTAIAAAALAMLSASAALAAPTLSISGPATAMVGQTFSLNVLASGLSDLYGYQFDLTFDASKFKATTSTEGSFLATAGSTFFNGGSPDNTAGSVSFVFDTLLGPGPGATGSGVLATFNFLTIGAGVGSFALSNVSALDSALNDITVASQSLGVTAAVPEPSTWAALLGGMAVLGFHSRRRKQG